MNVKIEATRRRGREYRLTTDLLLPTSRGELFEFFSDAFQLESITPSWLHFSVRTPPPIEMREGAKIDYQLRLHGVPIRWRSTISCWEPPHQFVDEQVKGPYRRWHHLHTFHSVDGGTLVRDTVHYSVPFGIFANPLVRRDLTHIFEFRRESMLRIFAKSSEKLSS